MKKVEAGQLVVVSHELDATVYRVMEVKRAVVWLIDATIEDTHPNQTEQTFDISLLLPPSVGQLKQFNAVTHQQRI